MKKIVRAMLTALLCLCLTGCTFLSKERVKLQDLDFTILSEEKIPEELLKIIEEKQGEPFRFTYSDNEFLYICAGYGQMDTGGYSIAVNELYLTDTAVYVNTELLGPSAQDKGERIPTCPYIVIKTDFREETVVFE